MSYFKLEKTFGLIGDLEHALAMLGWDEAVMMPAGGGGRRGVAMATLAGLIHERTSSDEVGDLLSACTGNPALSSWQTANVAEIERRWRRARALPNDLVIASTRAASESEQRWRLLRAENDFAGIRGALETVIDLTRQKAECLAAVLDLSPYDALLDEYEPGIGTARIDPIFAELVAKLPPLIDAAIDAQPAAVRLTGPFSRESQSVLASRLMENVGFDFERGRLDTSHHPFCGGDPDDARITTRYNEQDFLESMFAVLHETGHAMYEQGLPGAWRGQPVGGSGGMALHESQSLFVEMQISRSSAFLDFAAPILRETLAGADASRPEWSTHNLHALATRVERSFIRVDADELTYPLHVVLRYELEKELLTGSLAPADLPDAWDAGMREYLSLSTEGDFANGCMQDVHWYAGLIGYFPTYTLGAITAAQLFKAAGRSIDGLQERLAKGEFGPVVSWLREHVHGKGRSEGTAEIVEAATGGPLGTEAFLAHLESRYVG